MTTLSELPPPPAALAETDTPNEFRRFLDIVRRRKWVVIATGVCGLALGAYMSAAARPVYRATARLLVSAPAWTLQAVDASNPLSSLIAQGSEHSVTTQAQIVKSGPFLEKVYQDLGLKTSDRAQILGVDVVNTEDTDVLDISVDANSRTVAARVATSVGEHYVELSQASKREALRTTRAYLKDQSEQAERKLKEATDALTAFRLQTALQPGDDGFRISVQKSYDLQSELRTIQNQLTGTDAELSALRQQLALTPATVTEHTVSPQNEVLRTHVRELQGQLELMKLQYQDGSPILKAKQEELADAQAAEAREKPAVTDGATIPNPEYAKLQGRIGDLTPQRETLRVRLEDLQKQSAPDVRFLKNAPVWSAQLEELQRRKEEAATGAHDIAKNLRDLDVHEKALTQTARILEPAGPPAAPSNSSRLKTFLGALVMGLLAGVGLAVAQETLDNRIHSPDEAETIAAVPTLGVVPTIRDDIAVMLLSQERNSLTTEAYRAIRTAIQFSSVDCPIRTLLVTSAKPGEGKTVTALNLATVFALQNQRVIVVDADLRRPSTHSYLGLERRPGLSEVLAGQVPLVNALQETPSPNLRVLSAGERAPNPAEMLGAEAMTQLIEALRREADLVIIDSPPCLPVTDAEILASKVDAVVVIVEAGTSQRDTVRSTMELLRQGRARVIGTILNKIDQSKKGAYYHYYYYRGGYQYYNEASTRSAHRRWSLLGALRENGRKGADRRPPSGKR